MAGKIDIIPKNHLIYWSLIYSVIFTTVYLLAFFNVKFFEAQTFIIISLGLYSAGVGYLSTLAMRMGSD